MIGGKLTGGAWAAEIPDFQGRDLRLCLTIGPAERPPNPVQQPRGVSNQVIAVHETHVDAMAVMGRRSHDRAPGLSCEPDLHTVGARIVFQKMVEVGKDVPFRFGSTG